MSRTTYRGTPKAGLYICLSVDDGYVDRESNSITSQKRMLTQFAEYHGIEIVETYVDDGWSGTNFEDLILSAWLRILKAVKSTRSLQKTFHVLGVTTCRQGITPICISQARGCVT